MKQRKAKTERVTSEVRVKVDINLDGKGVYEIETGIPFFNHMLSQFAKHGYFDLKISAAGDLDVGRRPVEIEGPLASSDTAPRPSGPANNRAVMAVARLINKDQPCSRFKIPECDGIVTAALRNSIAPTRPAGCCPDFVIAPEV
jgi:hypothetical protein